MISNFAGLDEALAIGTGVTGPSSSQAALKLLQLSVTVALRQMVAINFLSTRGFRNNTLDAHLILSLPLRQWICLHA